MPGNTKSITIKSSGCIFGGIQRMTLNLPREIWLASRRWTEEAVRQPDRQPEVSRGQEARERRTQEPEPERYPQGFKGREKKDTIP